MKKTLLALFLSCTFLLHASPSQDTYRLSLCAIFKNEAPYLKEWIEFHLLQGVEHFFLYNNNSTDEYAKILEPYLQSNTVTLKDWNFTYNAVNQGDAYPWLTIQSAAYTNCIQTNGHLTTWLAFIDIDEFLFCPTGMNLPEFLQSYESFGGLCISRLFFGTSQLETLPSHNLLIEMLTRCARKESQYNSTIKSIIQPRHTKSALNAHVFQYKNGYFAIDPLGHVIENTIQTPEISLDQIRINHYWTRTEKYFREVKIDSRNNRRTYETKDRLRKRASEYNECIDREILQFVPFLKEKMK